jgi:RNA polymerase sigma-70 factor (ECF subfamily)
MPNRPPLSEEIIKAYRAGSVDAHNAVYDYYHRLVWQWGKRDLRNGDAVVDYVQDVFATLWKNREIWGGAHTFDEYVAATAMDLLLRYRRQRANEYRLIKKYLELYQAGDENSVESFMREMEFLEGFHREVDKLPPRQKEIFKLSQNGLTAGDIAERLNIEKETVYNQISRALDFLKRSHGFE